MLQKLIEASIRFRWLVLFAALGVSMTGVYSSFQLPLDAIPDLTNVQVQVATSAGSLSPIEVERYVTQPLEKQRRSRTFAKLFCDPPMKALLF